MGRVLGKAPVAHLGESELALDDSKRVLHLSPHVGLHLLSFVQQVTPRRVLIQCPAFARAHGHMPVHARGLGSLGRTLVARIRKHDLLIP